MLKDINENQPMLMMLKTKPLANRPVRGAKPFGKQSAERELFKKDVVRLKYAGYTSREISEYFNISKDTIDTIWVEEKADSQAVYTWDKAVLLLEQVYEIDKVIQDLKREISEFWPKDKVLKLKYLQMLLKYQQEREVLLWIKTNDITLTTNTDPIDKLFNLIKEENDWK